MQTFEADPISPQVKRLMMLFGQQQKQHEAPANWFLRAAADGRMSSVLAAACCNIMQSKREKCIAAISGLLREKERER
jgi:hypothetical protein